MTNCRRFLLFPCHDWTKWEDTSTGVICRGSYARQVGAYIRQTRRCTRCNKVQIRDAETR